MMGRVDVRCSERVRGKARWGQAYTREATSQLDQAHNMMQ